VIAEVMSEPSPLSATRRVTSSTTSRLRGRKRHRLRHSFPFQTSHQSSASTLPKGRLRSSGLPGLLPRCILLSALQRCVPQKTSTEFETCEVCRSEASTDFGTAECRCGQKARTIVEEESEEVEVERSIEPPSEDEEEESVIELEPEPVEVESVISPPSEVPTISDEVSPEDIPLPSSRSPASTLSSLSGGLGHLISPPTSVESTSISPVMSESTSSVQISAPSELHRPPPSPSHVTPSPTESPPSLSNPHRDFCSFPHQNMSLPPRLPSHPNPPSLHPSNVHPLYILLNGQRKLTYHLNPPSLRRQVPSRGAFPKGRISALRRRSCDPVPRSPQRAC
jgi:hypothetical protein